MKGRRWIRHRCAESVCNWRGFRPHIDPVYYVTRWLAEHRGANHTACGPTLSSRVTG